MKRILFISLLFSAGLSHAQQEFRKIPNPAFTFGEVLKFRVHYGIITAGEAVLQVSRAPITVDSHGCYHFIGTGTSASSFDWFYKVRDRYETFVDTAGLFPWNFKRTIDEASFYDYTEVKFDPALKKAYEKGKVYDVPEYCHDVLSAFYYARTLDFSNAKPGDIFTVQNFIDQKVFDLQVKYVGKEDIKCELGKFHAVKLEPLVQEGGVFLHKGQLFLWISDDKNRIPLMIEAGLIIGSIKVNLKYADGLKNPMDSKIGK